MVTDRTPRTATPKRSGPPGPALRRPHARFPADRADFPFRTRNRESPCAFSERRAFPTPAGTTLSALRSSCPVGECVEVSVCDIPASQACVAIPVVAPDDWIERHRALLTAVRQSQSGYGV
ncbi:DUF5959 family protein [Streptomyces sp. NPDC057381]|uniref:DUF5959 family protein n=1 Tax=unclassified Streptomyces TaxID=2593676 RepID=UPI00363140BF